MIIQLFVFLVSYCAVCNAQTKSDWTICVYVNADNNLEPFISRNIEQMIQASTNAQKLNIFVRVDRNVPHSKKEPLGNIPFSSNAQDIYIGGGQATVIEDLGERNMDDPSGLTEFVYKCVGYYPAIQYGLILWDHGGAYKGYGPDDTPKRAMSVSSLYGAISYAMSMRGLNKFDFFGFDACLMANLETINYAAPIARVFVASMELEPGHGWDYRALEIIVQKPFVSPYYLGQEIVDRFITIADSEQSGRASLIVVDLAGQATVKEAIRKLADYMVTCNTNEDLLRIISRARLSSWIPADTATAEDHYGLVDLHQVLLKIQNSQNPAYTSFPLQFQKLVMDCIFALGDMTYYYKTDPTMKETKGLSIYWPYSSTIDQTWIANGGVYSTNSWKNFLESYLAAPGEKVTSLEIAQIGLDTNSNIVVDAIAFPVSAVSVAFLSWGYAVNGRDYLITWSNAPIDYNTGRIKGTNDKIWVTAYCLDKTDLQTCFPAYSNWKRVDSKLLLKLDLYYYQKGSTTDKPVTIVITFDSLATTIEKEEYFLTENDVTASFYPVVGDTFYTKFYDTNYKPYQSAFSFEITTDGLIPSPTYFSLTTWSCSVGIQVDVYDLKHTTTADFDRYTGPNCTPKNYIFEPQPYVPSTNVNLLTSEETMTLSVRETKGKSHSDPETKEEIFSDSETEEEILSVPTTPKPHSPCPRRV